MNNCPPSILLVHGLDSWRGTWRRAARELAARGFSSLAVDLRGHGQSPLGDGADFSCSQLAADIRAAAEKAGLLGQGRRIALVGHSLGGLLALRYAANYPEDVSALVLEDIDCVPRQPRPELTSEQLERCKAFRQGFVSWPACRDQLCSLGYSARRLEGWRKEDPPRICEDGVAGGGAVWSHVNPYAQYLAHSKVLCTSDGLDALEALSSVGARGRLLVAGPKWTVCSWEAKPGGILDMCARVPWLEAVEFPGYSHSIHSAAPAVFASAVADLVGLCSPSRKFE